VSHWWKFTTCNKHSRSVAVWRCHQNKAMHDHVEALRQAAQKFENLTLVSITRENSLPSVR